MTYIYGKVLQCSPSQIARWKVLATSVDEGRFARVGTTWQVQSH
jgi:hypothetical protein